MPTKKRLQKFFVAGLLVWLPMVVTVWMLLWMLRLVDSIFIALVAALERFVSPLNGFSQWVHSFPGFGVAVLGLMILFTGLLVSNIVGAWWLRQWDKMLVHIPVFRSIYSSVKQVSDTLFSGGGKAFSKALLVQYPRPGSWTVAFLTGSPAEEINHLLPSEHVSIYVPTTPNPTSGYFLIVPRSDVIELNMSVDDALKYVISMGVVTPHEAAVALLQEAQLPPPEK